MSDIKTKAKENINAAAATARQASDKVVDKSREIARNAGKTIEKQGKRLQNL